MSTKSAPAKHVAAARDKALVLFPGALGDFICFMPALQALAQHREVHLLARSEFADLTTVSVRSLERYEIRRLFAPGAAEEERIRQFFGAYARVYSWFATRQEQFVRTISELAPHGGRFFSFRPATARIHQAAYYLSCLGPSVSHAPPAKIALNAEAATWSGGFWTRHKLVDRAVLTIGPGSGSREKTWPLHGFSVVADWWRSVVKGEIVVLLGPAEEERGGFERLGSQSAVARNLTLAQAAALLRRSRLYLGNDSGITHLAAAVGVPTLALFGPSDPEIWRPLGKHVGVTYAAGSTARANAPGKYSVYTKALPELTPAEVIVELEKLRDVASLTLSPA